MAPPPPPSSGSPSPGGSSPPTAKLTKVHLQEFTPGQRSTVSKTVHALEECSGAVAATFVSFARTLEDEGFGFLRSRMDAGRVGPVLVAIDEDRTIGAIGPMGVMRDFNGSARLLPRSLGVLPWWRGRGHGRVLWRAATQSAPGRDRSASTATTGGLTRPAPLWRDAVAVGSERLRGLAVGNEDLSTQ